MTENYKDQDNKLAKLMLERIYYKSFQKGEKEIELFLTGQCSAHCEYCYLNKHSKELYPLEYHNIELILKNLDTTLKWYKNNKFKATFSIFSAEWLNQNDLRDQVFNIFYDNFKTEQYYKPQSIVIPTNMQFIHDDNMILKIQEWIDKFNNIGIQIKVSGSIDGKYCDDFRTPVDDTFYEKCFKFLEKNDFHCHPMVSSHNCENWIQNYEWWRTVAPEKIGKGLMMLEVRDQSWDDTNIESLLKFLNYQIDYQFNNDFNQDKKEFLKYIFRKKNKYLNLFPSYCNLALHSTFDLFDNTDTTHCSVNHTNLVIRLGDMAILPCHRQGYKELILGHYIIENNEIIDFEIKNIELFIAYNHLKKSCYPHCECCKFIGLCPGFCLGNSYEEYKNPFIPVKEVCKMYKSKYRFLIWKYYNLGLFENLEDLKELIPEMAFNYINDILLDILQPQED